MASSEVGFNMCSRFLDQNFMESDRNTCEKCLQMKNYLEKLICELKSTQLITKILNEDIKSTSAGSWNQPNLKSSVECKPYND